jgi:hypothetical protein
LITLSCTGLLNVQYNPWYSSNTTMYPVLRSDNPELALRSNVLVLVHSTPGID